MTDAERALWKCLRGDFDGTDTHFRRQVPIGRFVTDFCCLRHRIIVEIDGPIHDTGSARAYDRSRIDYLADQGFRILRFSNDDVSRRRDAVLAAIKAALGASTPTPSPSPQGGGESRLTE